MEKIHYDTTPGQDAYFAHEHAAIQPALHTHALNLAATHAAINEDMETDNVAFFANRLRDESFPYTFDYTQCYTLFEFSENLERWCKEVTRLVRDTRTYQEVAGANDGDPPELVITQTHNDAPQLCDKYGDELTPAGHHNFLLRIFIGPDYTMRVLCSAPHVLGCFFGKGFRNVFKLPRFLDHDIVYAPEGAAGIGSPNDYRHCTMPTADVGTIINGDLEDREFDISHQVPPFTPKFCF